MTLKVELLQEAFVEMRISGITVDPTPGDLELGLVKLESMAAEFDARNICTGFVFEDEPDPNTESGISLAARQAFVTSLALRMLAAFGKPAPMELSKQAAQSLSALGVLLAVKRETPYPTRQARGSGNTLRFSRWWRFYKGGDQAPISCSTQQISREEINDFSADFSGYLDDGETIDSYISDSTAGLTMLSETLTDAVIDYRVECSKGASDYEVVTFFVKTSLGRQKDFLVNFNVS